LLNVSRCKQCPFQLVREDEMPVEVNVYGRR
jgi:hypothetical protein